MSSRCELEMGVEVLTRDQLKEILGDSIDFPIVSALCGQPCDNLHTPPGPCIDPNCTECKSPGLGQHPICVTA